LLPPTLPAVKPPRPVQSCVGSKLAACGKCPEGHSKPEEVPGAPKADTEGAPNLTRPGVPGDKRPLRPQHPGDGGMGCDPEVASDAALRKGDGAKATMAILLASLRGGGGGSRFCAMP